MKKTIILILTAMAASSYAGDITFDYTEDGKTTEPIASAPSITGAATIVSGAFTGTYNNGANWNGDMYGTGAAGTVVTPWLVVGEDNVWTYTLTFSVTEAMTTDTISVALFTFGGGGRGETWTYNDDIRVKHVLTLSGGDLTSTSVTRDAVSYLKATQADKATLNLQNWTIAGSSGAIVDFDLGNEVSLKTGEQYTLSLSVSDAHPTDRPNYLLGLGGIRIESVPEPATATLSLLALAGLAARRRRK